MDETSAPRNPYGFPPHVAMPEGLVIKRVGMENPYMRAAFEHAQKHQERQKASGMRAVTSALVTQDGTVVMGVAGELTNHIQGDHENLQDDETWHARTGRCDRVQSNGNVDYDKCPGCRHDRHSERSAVRKALRDGINLTESSIYLYGQWWVCEPCAQASFEAGVRTIYLLPEARDLFDRALTGQAERLSAFQEKWQTR